MRARRRVRHRKAAVMADEPPPEAVIDEPGVAIRAGKAIAAGAAERERRIAAPIEKQQRLLLAFERELDLLGEAGCDKPAARRTLAGEIDRLDHRQGLAAEPFGQCEPAIAPAARIHLGLHRGRRRGEHDRYLGDMGTHHRHVAGVVAHAVLLLVGRVVLLIDHDQAEIGERQKQRRARADDHARFAGRHRAPSAGALPRGEFGMPFRRPHAEPCGEAVEELRRKRDLRHQNERLPAGPDHLRHRLEIDLGLARPGDAVEQRDAVAAVPNGLPQRRGRRALRRCEVRGPEIGIGRARNRLGRHDQGFERAFVDQAVNHARRYACLFGRLALAPQQAVGEQRQNPRPRRGHAGRLWPRDPHRDACALGAERFAHAQRHPQHHAARRQRVVGDPIDEAAQLFPQRRNIEPAGDILEPVIESPIGRILLGPHDAGIVARAERHGDEIARSKRDAVHSTIGIGMVERDRDQHVEDPLGHLCRAGPS